MRHAVQRAFGRVGFRGTGLLTFACVCFAYGSGLLTDYHPTFFSAYGISTGAFGWGFVALGCISLTGVLLRTDRYHYAFATLCITGWVILLSTHWTQPGGWAASVSWMGVGGALVIASAWPEPARVIEAAGQLPAWVAQHEQPDGSITVTENGKGAS